MSHVTVAQEGTCSFSSVFLQLLLAETLIDVQVNPRLKA